MCGSPRDSRRLRRCAAFGAAIVVAATVAGLAGAAGAQTRLGPATTLHYAPNGNFGAGGAYLPGRDGFNLADVTTTDQLAALPARVRGLVYLGLCDGVDASFVDTVSPFIGKAKVYGFYLADEPDPTGRYAPLCPASNLRAEADWIHAHVPGAKTFIVLMNLGTNTEPDYAQSYTSSNTDIDLFGLDPYPCRGDLHGCDYAVIGATVRAAEATGIRREQIVPVYQAFGGGGYSDWTLPNAAQERRILAAWGALTPAPGLDFAYSWGRQKGDHSLVDTPALQAVFRAHNRQRS